MAQGKSFFGGGGSEGAGFLGRWVYGGGGNSCVACFFSQLSVEVQQVDLRALNILGCTKYHICCLRPCKQILLLL